MAVCCTGGDYDVVRWEVCVTWCSWGVGVVRCGVVSGRVYVVWDVVL